MRLRDDVYFYPSKSGMDFSGEINCNTIIITGSKHMLIDPGLVKYWDELKEKIVADGLNLADIDLVFCSHSHPDHCEAAVKVAKEVGADLFMSLAELDFIVMGGICFYYRSKDGVYIPVAGNMPYFDVPDTSLFIKGFAGPFFFQGNQFKLFLTPGHTPGSMCLHWPEQRVLVTGDVYFPGTFGATDLFGGSATAMYRSIKLLGGLMDVDLVLCGHGPAIDGRQLVVENNQALNAEVADKMARGIV